MNNYGKGFSKLSLLIAVLAAGSLLATMAGGASAETFNVTVGPGITFTPNNLTVRQGDTVKWTNASGGCHNVQTGRRTSPAWFEPARGYPPTDILCTTWSASRVHDQIGTIMYYCAVPDHAWGDVDGVPTMGQVMTVNVVPADSTGPTGPSGGGPTGPTGPTGGGPTGGGPSGGGPSGGGPSGGSGPTAQSPGATQPTKKSKKGKKSKKSKAKGKKKK